jgi:catechol 2,3-dioxygenase-like lactoylglutathione lyase family enzyme
MRFNHYGLPVRDERRSQEFYSQYFGFDPATAQTYEDGTVIIRDAAGFDLALHPSEQVEPSPAFLHAGFRASTPHEVRMLLARMQADGVIIVERDEEPALVGFKCLDPVCHPEVPGGTTTMWQRRGQDHYDVAASWSGPGPRAAGVGVVRDLRVRVVRKGATSLTRHWAGRPGGRAGRPGGRAGRASGRRGSAAR